MSLFFIGPRQSAAVALSRGLIVPLVIDAGAYSLRVLVAPGADLDAETLAYDVDECELLRVRGWLYHCVPMSMQERAELLARGFKLQVAPGQSPEDQAAVARWIESYKLADC